MRVWLVAWRLVRRRVVLTCILLCSLTYFLLQTGLLPSLGGPDIEEQMLALQKMTAHRQIQWLADDPVSRMEGNGTSQCRNTRQGKVQVTDDRGYTCLRSDLLLNGCCDASRNGSKLARFSCEACSAVNGCCSNYETCVSCCLRPEQKKSLLAVIQATSGHRLRHFLSVKDQFELCLLKCRTSSNSVHSENKYKSVNLKYCYMLEPESPFQK